MSLVKLKKNANRPIPSPEGPQKYRPVLLGDRIGAKIQKQKNHSQHRNITWWCEGGRNANSQLYNPGNPIFSIAEWNKKQKEKNIKYKKSADLEEDQSQKDHLLESQLIEVNKAIQQINQENNHKPANFNSDLYRTSNRQAKKYKGDTESKRHGDTESRRLYNISLLYDGIHPSYHLARAWLMKFTIQTIKDCWVPNNQVEAREKDINNNSI
ncbi:unnamed protein product [Mytilus coruscus]|uniref:Uncharacterized protein n=1 Tax=Mytilus coruscus TaxID=42192 RepID=A0A6J8D1Y0_MYTCO|nr:unnamed protein product [Mytilus coruscus]